MSKALNTSRQTLADTSKNWWQKLWTVPKELFARFDKRVDGAISFFFKHYGKTKFMLAMSKRAQTLGLERLFLKGPKAFIYFFLFYLIRDTILYIIIPIYIAYLAE